MEVVRYFYPYRFYQYLKKEERSFQIVYVSSDKYVCHHVLLLNSFSIPYSTKDAMLGYMQEQKMPWVGVDFDSLMGEQLRGDFKSVSYH